MRNNPQQILDEMPMGRLQVAAVCICVLLNGLDGFDVLAISFAAPGIAAEWGINRAALGVVLSMELIGMSIGSIFLGGVADRFGRRPMILLCLVLMTAGMFLAAQAGDVVTLSLIRLVTGLGIGGMLASTNAMVAEYSNARRRDFCIAVMVAGYPLGVIIGGTFASMLLAYFDWRSVFLLGAVGTAAMFPVVWLFLPESIAHLVHKRGPGALEKINATLKRMGHGIIDALPELAQEGPKASWRDLFSPGLVRITLLLTLCYLTHIMTFYFILKWVPKIVVDMGFAASAAGGVLVWASVGGAAGSYLFGWLTHYFRLRRLVIFAMAGSVIMVNIFGQGQSDLTTLAAVACMAGIFTNSAIVGLYALFARLFPTHLRAGGTGFVIGVGRAGAVLGPIIAGILFESGEGLAGVAFIMALGSLVAAILLTMLRDPDPS